MRTVARQLKTSRPQMPMVSYRDVFDLDFPHERDRMSRMDKYTLRDWIVGHMVIQGWDWYCLRDDMVSNEGKLQRGGVIVRVSVRSDGVRLVSGDHVMTLATEL